MPRCSFKNCKNHTSRTKKKDGISYFRFPRDPIRCAKWISITAQQRSEEFFKPTPSSVVCSNHFDESDEYVTPNGMKKLHKTAIPRIEENSNSVKDDSAIDTKTIEKRCSQPQLNIKEAVAENVKSPTSSLSIGSILDTPKKTIIKKELVACKRLIKIKNSKISNLRKQNIRLKKKNIHLKDVLSLLNKRQTVDQLLLHELSKHIEVIETFLLSDENK